MGAWSRPTAGAIGCLLHAGASRAQEHPTLLSRLRNALMMVIYISAAVLPVVVLNVRCAWLLPRFINIVPLAGPEPAVVSPRQVSDPPPPLTASSDGIPDNIARI